MRRVTGRASDEDQGSVMTARAFCPTATLIDVQITVAQGDDPSPTHREHAVSTIVPAPAMVDVDPWGPHADHDQLAAAGDLLKLGPQAVL
jgi:hypothetical protein